jgi:hypothetical protein
MGAVVWAEAPGDPADDGAETEAHGEIDETFAARRLGRWLRGMFGGNEADVDPRPRDESEQPGD